MTYPAQPEAAPNAQARTGDGSDNKEYFMAPAEQWKPIPGFPDYSVSDTGRIVSYKARQPREMKFSFSYNGYPQLELSVDGNGVTRKVHQLVASAFLGECPQGMEVRHLDGVKTNNDLRNLVYGTRSENMRDLVEHGAHNNASKTNCRQGHAFDEGNTYMWRGKRKCRTCMRAAGRAFAERRAFRAANVPSEVAA